MTEPEDSTPTDDGNAETEAPAPARRVLEIGWIIDSDQAQFVYKGPTPMSCKAPPPRSAKAASLCPAILDHEAQYYEIPCPFDLSLKLNPSAQGRPGITNTAGLFSAISQPHLEQLMSFPEPVRWRARDKPILQLQTPYRFVADEEVWMEQMPPFNSPAREAWPGVFQGERFPIDIWPRKLIWSFEWHDLQRELVIKRGEPWFYLCFETANPLRPLRLIEAEITPALRDYCHGLDGIVDFSDREFFDTARARRPKSLLQPVQR